MHRRIVSISWAFLALMALALATAQLWTPIHPHAQADPVATQLLAPGSKRILVETIEGQLRVGEAIERQGSHWHLIREGETLRFPLEEVQRVEPLAFRWGTDRFGRDVLARTLHGGRNSLFIALIALLLGTVIGVTVGGVAGFAGGWVDEISMRVCDGLLGFPRLVLLLTIAAVTRPTLWTLIIVLAMTSWMGTARLIRADVRSLRDRDFVVAARGTGLTPARILGSHILPHLQPTLLVDTTLRFGELILLEASLSYLGLGLPEPSPSWGSMINEGRADFTHGWWVSAFPSVALVATIVALVLLSDAYRSRARKA